MNPLLEPPCIPCWQGPEPIRFYIAPEMRRFESDIHWALLAFLSERMPDGRPLRLKVLEVSVCGLPRCIEFRMEPLVGLLGLGFYPPPLNREPTSGNVILNMDAFSRSEFRPLVLPTLIHEIAAHSLGLGHLYLRRSVRCPYIEEGKINLSAEDRAALLTMYGT